MVAANNPSNALVQVILSRHMVRYGVIDYYDKIIIPPLDLQKALVSGHVSRPIEQGLVHMTASYKPITRRKIITHNLKHIAKRL